MLARDVEEKVMGESHRYSRGRRLREGDATWKQAHEEVFKNMDDLAPLSFLLGAGSTVGLTTIFSDWLMAAPPGLAGGGRDVMAMAGMLIGSAVSYATLLLRAKKRLEAKRGQRTSRLFQRRTPLPPI